MFIVYFSYFNISHDTIFSLPPSIYTKLLESQALCFIETIFVCPFMNSNQTPFNSATEKTLIKKKKKKNEQIAFKRGGFYTRQLNKQSYWFNAFIIKSSNTNLIKSTNQLNQKSFLSSNKLLQSNSHVFTLLTIAIKKLTDLL